MKGFARVELVRPHPLANPFVMGRVEALRGIVCDAFEYWWTSRESLDRDRSAFRRGSASVDRELRTRIHVGAERLRCAVATASRVDEPVSAHVRLQPVTMSLIVTSSVSW